jgi:hypothetical protein
MFATWSLQSCGVVQCYRETSSNETLPTHVSLLPPPSSHPITTVIGTMPRSNNPRCRPNRQRNHHLALITPHQPPSMCKPTSTSLASPPNSNAEMSPSNTHPQKSNLHRGAAGVGGDAASSYPSANAHNKRIECGEEERLGYSLPIPNFFTRIHQTGIALAASNFLVDRIKASMV